MISNVVVVSGDVISGHTESFDTVMREERMRATYCVALIRIHAHPKSEGCEVMQNLNPLRTVIQIQLTVAYGVPRAGENAIPPPTQNPGFTSRQAYLYDQR
jgi:hypothetical protein